MADLNEYLDALNAAADQAMAGINSDALNSSVKSEWTDAKGKAQKTEATYKAAKPPTTPTP